MPEATEIWQVDVNGTVYGIQSATNHLHLGFDIKDKEIVVDTTFDVPLEDHDIKIPKVVNQKIASVIMVEVKANLKPKA